MLCSYIRYDLKLRHPSDKQSLWWKGCPDVRVRQRVCAKSILLLTYSHTKHVENAALVTHKTCNRVIVTSEMCSKQCPGHKVYSAENIEQVINEKMTNKQFWTHAKHAVNSPDHKQSMLQT